MRVPPEISKQYGCEELYWLAYYHPDDKDGMNPAHFIMYPEIGKRQVSAIMKAAVSSGHRISIVCDTGAQEREIAKLAKKVIPAYEERSLAMAKDGFWPWQ